MRHYLCVSGCNRDCVNVTNTWWGDVRRYGKVETNANGEERRAKSEEGGYKTCWRNQKSNA